MENNTEQQQNEQPPQPAPEAPAPQTAAPAGTDVKQWTMFLHLSGLLGIFVPIVGGVAGPLVIWLLKKQEFPALDQVGKDVLNFQISWAVWMLIAWVIGTATCLLLVVSIGLWVAWLVFTVLGAVKANNGETYKFPLTIDVMGFFNK